MFLLTHILSSLKHYQVRQAFITTRFIQERDPWEDKSTSHLYINFKKQPNQTYFKTFYSFSTRIIVSPSLLSSTCWWVRALSSPVTTSPRPLHGNHCSSCLPPGSKPSLVGLLCRWCCQRIHRGPFFLPQEPRLVSLSAWLQVRVKNIPNFH